MSVHRKMFDTKNKDSQDPWEQAAPSAELRLWCAVVERTVLDWRECFSSIKKQIEKSGTYSLYQRYMFNQIKHEVLSDHFELVCEMANVSRAKVLTLLLNEAKLSGLYTVEPKKSGYVQHLATLGEGFH
jgi:hypothetical protein